MTDVVQATLICFHVGSLQLEELSASQGILTMLCVKQAPMQIGSSTLPT